MASLQELTNYEATSPDNVMDVRTEFLEPIHSTGNTFKHTFRIDTMGFLDKNTLLCFKTKATANSGNLRANTFNGVLGAIKRVRLLFGDFEIQDLDNCGMWATLNHLVKMRPDSRRKKMGHYLANALDTQVLQETDNSISAQGGLGQTGQIYPNNDTSGINYGLFDNSSATGGNPSINSFAITDTVADNIKTAIPLGMLVPALEERNIPLFLFTDYKVFLEVEFNSATSEWCNNVGNNAYNGNANLAATDGTVQFSEVELLIDYLIFPSRVQEDYRAETQRDGGLTLDFMNVSSVDKTIPAATADTKQQIEHRINAVDTEIHYLQQIKKLPASANGWNRVLLDQRSDGITRQTVQYNINGVNVFPEPIFSPLQQYNQLTYNLGQDLQLDKPFFCKDVNTCSCLLSPPSGQLLGKFNVNALDLQTAHGGGMIRGNGTMIGNYPIRVIYERTPVASTNSEVSGTPVACEAETGVLEVNYFVGQTRLVNVVSMPNGGMNIGVSNL
tara:strand:- start:3425 stop:4930 length:1506 start_codon:yes stop_codon:yes gene_type:complete